MTRRQTAGIAISAIVLIAILAFFVVSLCLASAHGNTLVAEWQTWFGIVKDVTETLPSEEGAEVVANIFKIIG